MTTIHPEVSAGRSKDDWSPDEELVRRIRAGNTRLFEILMRRYNQRLYRIARAIVKDEAEAEDVMQQAYVNAYTHLDQFADRARFSTWLTKIAVYEALARVRRRLRVAEIDALSGPDEEAMGAMTWKGPDPEQQMLAAEVRRVLESAIDALPEGFRSVFLLRAVEGLSTAETAECLDIGEDTVKTRLHRARALLRKELYACTGLVTAAAFPFNIPRCDRMVSVVFRRLELGTPFVMIH